MWGGIRSTWTIKGKLNRYKTTPCANEHSRMNKTAFTKGRHSIPSHFSQHWKAQTNYTDHIHHAALHKDQAKGQHSTPRSQSPQPTSTIPPPHFPQHMKPKSKLHWLRGRDSSVVRASDSWLKGRGFKSPLERWENCLLQGQLSVLTLISVSVPAPCYHSST